MISALIRADSISPAGDRITTLELNMPRFLLAQFNTHRMFSRNAASSRAIPTSVLIDRVEADPYIPQTWRQVKSGMVAGDPLPDDAAKLAREEWLFVLEVSLDAAKALADLGAAKETVNRLLEPFAWVKVLVTATDWANFFKLRLHHTAQPEMQELAVAMKAALDTSTPANLHYYQWHMPFGEHMPVGTTLTDRLRIATARCARISYLTHDGNFTLARDLALHDQLVKDGHLSPLEHCATPWMGNCFNLKGWASYRWFHETNKRHLIYESPVTLPE